MRGTINHSIDQFEKVYIVKTSNCYTSIRGVHVQAGLFNSGADFELFHSPRKNKIHHRVSILYGRNGSGKTTISQQISRIAAGDSCNNYFWDEARSPISLTSEEKQAIRVFNEDYVREKVLFQEEGLDTIVMLGTKAQAQKRIDEIDAELIEVGEKFVEWNSKKEQAESGSNSIESLLAEAKSKAKDGGWADRCCKITGTRSNLTAQKWDETVTAETNRSRQEIESEYAEGLAKYQKAKNTGSEIIAKINLIDERQYNETALVELLNRTLDEPVLTEREERIFALIQNGNQGIVEYARKITSDEKVDSCPLCHQTLTPEYKESLRKSILKVLNEEVDSFKKNLEDCRISNINEEELGLDKVPEDMLPQCQKALGEISSIIARYDELIDKRLASLYEPIKTEPLGLTEAITSFNNSANNVNREVDDLNLTVKNKTTLRKQLLNLNNQIARIDAEDAITRHIAVKEELDTAKKELHEAIEKRSRLENERRTEEAKMSMTDLAANAINGFLANVFFDSSRFVLVPHANVYKIESHGKPVKPHEVSTGERNILALCYFFSEGGKLKFEGSEDTDPQYIILDDPISSFDMENRIGICSLIRERAAHILESNPDSLITVMTHDIGIATELKNTFDDVGNIGNEISNSFATDCFELREDATCDLQLKKSRYMVLLKRAYDFAISDEEDEKESYVIGNILRRILEGYSSFNYGIGVEKLSRDKELAVRFGEASRLITNIMYRLALNDESHLKESLDAFNPPIVFDRYSYQEKVTIAQCVFVILDYLDRDHVVKQLAHFEVSKKDVNRYISEWRKKFISEIES